MPRLPVVSPTRVVTILKRLGFEERRQTGSHLILRHPVTRKIVPVPMHRGDLKPGTLRSILRMAELTLAEFSALLKRR
ncbi:type II toxin-antitoxin system HicA family toxin [Candidatus Berkelbacteria bacterium]|nr:type II toxin-antitoxin system HicA family toxin [Candidatus Berkelbacteria bacterium]